MLVEVCVCVGEMTVGATVRGRRGCGCSGGQL